MDKAYLNHIISTSHVAEVDRANVPQVFAENMARFRSDYGYTQEELSYMLGIGKQTYVRIESGNNASVNAEIAIKAANIFHVPVMSLFGFSTSNVEAYKDYMKCTERTQKMLRSIMTADLKMQELFSDFDKDDLITVLSFPEEIHDGMIVSRFLHRTENISQYKKFSWYKDAHCILEINSNAYHPLYHIGDRLVICTRTPLDAEIGIFLKGSEFYLRKVENSPESSRMVPVAHRENMPCEELIVDRRNREDMNQYSKFGTIVAVI